jgi:hydroxyethylthiazole kinase-like uncharacterized protein yjeF
MKEYVRGDSEDCAVMSREQVRAFDARAINELGVHGVVLMENAGRSCAEYIIEHFGGHHGAKVCIFCGTGNNGGDGYVIARHLVNAGFETLVVICGDRGRVKGDARINLSIIERMGVLIAGLELLSGNIPVQVQRFTAGCDMVVDALFGTGLRGELGSEHAQLITCLNVCECPIVAVDIPSGLDCDTGLPLPVCIEAEATVTFAAVKKGFVSVEAAKATGRVYIASIGVEPGE